MAATSDETGNLIEETKAATEDDVAVTDAVEDDSDAETAVTGAAEITAVETATEAESGSETEAADPEKTESTTSAGATSEAETTLPTGETAADATETENKIAAVDAHVETAEPSADAAQTGNSGKEEANTAETAANAASGNAAEADSEETEEVTVDHSEDLEDVLDTHKPGIMYISLDSHELSAAHPEINVTVKAEDDVSGFDKYSDISLNFQAYDQNGDEVGYAYANTHRNEDTGLYEGTISFSSNNSAGIYHLSYISCTDEAGNSQRYDADSYGTDSSPIPEDLLTDSWFKIVNDTTPTTPDTTQKELPELVTIT